MNSIFTEETWEGIKDRPDMIKLLFLVTPENTQRMIALLEEMELCPVCGQRPRFISSFTWDNQPLYQFRCCNIHTSQGITIEDSLRFWNAGAMNFPPYLRLKPADVVCVRTPERRRLEAGGSGPCGEPDGGNNHLRGRRVSGFLHRRISGPNPQACPMKQYGCW